MIVNFNKVGLRYKRLIRKVFQKAIEKTGNENVEIIVSVAFVKEERIKELNKISRNVDRVTDVLSFPMLDIHYPQKISEFSHEFLPDGFVYLGDVVICKKRAKQQAKEFGHSSKREICFLALHGFLHVLGYDHIEKDDEEVMQNMAKNILDDIGIKRGGNV